MKNLSSLFTIFVCITVAGAAIPVNAAAVPVTALGISSATGQDWATDGFLTLNGNTIGLDVSVAGYYAGTNGNDIEYAGGQNQNTEVGQTIQFPSSGEGLGVAGTVSDEAVNVGSSLYADVAATNDPYLIISEVTPAAGTYDLDGVSITATQTGQVLQWAAALADLQTVGNTFTFSSNASADVNGYGPGQTYVESLSGGPIGFSAGDVPEPAAWSSLLLGVASLFFLGRRASFNR